MLLFFFTPQKMDADTINLGETYENNVTVRFLPKRPETLPETGELSSSYLKKVGVLLLLIIFVATTKENAKNSE